MQKKTYGFLKKVSLALAIVGVGAELGLGITGSVISGKATKEMRSLDPVVNTQEFKEAEKQDDLGRGLIGGAAAGMLTAIGGAVGTYAFWCKENGWKVRGISREEKDLEKQ